MPGQWAWSMTGWYTMFAEHDMVKVIDNKTMTGDIVPIGSIGAIVHIYPTAQVYVIEFPDHSIADCEESSIVPTTKEDIDLFRFRQQIQII